MLWKKMQCYFGMDSACSHCPGAFAECTVACENTALVSPSASASPRLQLTVNLCHSFFITIFCPWQFSRADFQESIKHAEQVVVTTIWLSVVHICRSITTPKSIMQMRSRFSAYFNTKFSGFTSLCK
ncbi:hypothetical protein T06_15381 [Trichinella sp. T6]|nr:hypothetical protein T06_15381 [Trichinella sp. T6]